MKKLFTTIGIITALAVTVFATDIKLQWDLNPPAEMVSKYVIYQATSTNGAFTPVVTIPGTTNVGSVKGLTSGFYRFIVIAQNSIGNSPPSNEVSIPTNSPAAAKNVILLEVK